MRRHGHHGWDGPRQNWQTAGGSMPWRRFGRWMAFGFLIAIGFAFAVISLLLWVFARVASLGAVSLVAVPFLIALAVALVGRSLFRTWWPVRSLINTAGSLADGDYSVRAAGPRSGAMRRVVQSFNRMADRLEDSDENRRRLLADLGHELRNPLTVVRGGIEAIVDGVHQPDADHLEALLDEVAVMERLLEDLRTLSMAEAGVLSLHPEPTDIGTLVGDVVESHRPAAEHAAVVVGFERDPALGEAMVDPVRIREVVTNVVINALRAMPVGGALTVRVAAPSRDRMTIVVKDTGVGIPVGELGHVFERFHRGSTSSGSGLGLTISRDLVAGHGGTIDIESDVGIGTTVTVSLPIVRV